jgi:hypothetical protein
MTAPTSILEVPPWLSFERPQTAERIRNLAFAMAGLAFVFGGLTVFAIGDGTEQIWAVLGIALFGLGAVEFLRKLS